MTDAITPPESDEILASWPAPKWADTTETGQDLLFHSFTPPSNADLYISGGRTGEPEKLDVTLQAADSIEIVHGRGVRIVRTAPEIIIGELICTPEQAKILRETIDQALAALTH